MFDSFHDLLGLLFGCVVIMVISFVIASLGMSNPRR